MEYYNENLKLLKCKKGLILKENKCVTKGECFELCEECSQGSKDINNQFCISCKNNLYLENSNCKEQCSNGYMISGKECIKCNNKEKCELFKNNSCECIKCKGNYFLNLNNSCEECSLECKSCSKEKNNCTSCFDGKYLSQENKCLNCSEKCKTCDNGFINGNDNCLSCDNSNNSVYKYLIDDNGNKTCVENCEFYGKELNGDSTMCVSLRNSDYMLWVLIIIFVIILIVVIVIILKKFYFGKENIYNEEMSFDLNDKVIND